MVVYNGTDLSGNGLSSDNLKSMNASSWKKQNDMPEQATVGIFQRIRDAVAKGTTAITEAFNNITGKSNDETTPKTTDNVENKPEAKSTANDKAKNAMGNFGKKGTQDVSVKDTATNSIGETMVKNGMNIATEIGSGALGKKVWALDPDNPPPEGTIQYDELQNMLNHSNA